MLSPDELKKAFGNDPKMLNKLQELSKMLETMKNNPLNSQPNEISPEMKKKMLKKKLNTMKLQRMSNSSKELKKSQ